MTVRSGQNPSEHDISPSSVMTPTTGNQVVGTQEKFATLEATPTAALEQQTEDEKIVTPLTD